MPRQVVGYEAVCRAGNLDELEPLTNGSRPERLPGGEWRVAVPIDRKAALLELSARNRIVLESLRPMQEEIEEVLFKFAGGPKAAGKERAE